MKDSGVASKVVIVRPAQRLKSSSFGLGGCVDAWLNAWVKKANKCFRARENQAGLRNRTIRFVVED